MSKIEILGLNKKAKNSFMSALAENVMSDTQRNWIVQICYPNKRGKKAKHYWDYNKGKDRLYYVYIFANQGRGWGTDVSYTKNWFDKEDQAIKCAEKLAKKYGYPMLKIEKRYYSKKHGRAI
jgi:hypothetical protein